MPSMQARASLTNSLPAEYYFLVGERVTHKKTCVSRRGRVSVQCSLLSLFLFSLPLSSNSFCFLSIPLSLSRSLACLLYLTHMLHATSPIVMPFARPSEYELDKCLTDVVVVHASMYTHTHTHTHASACVCVCDDVIV